MSALVRFLYPLPTTRRTPGELLMWWEKRRLPYNLVVGASGLVSLGIINVISALPPRAHPVGIPLFAVIAFGVGANVCYTGGWVIDTALALAFKDDVRPAGPALFRQGLIFSVGLSLLPVVIASVDWAVRLVFAMVR